MVAVTDEEGDYFSTFPMTRAGLWGIAVAVVGALFVLVFLFSFLSRLADRNLQARELAKKNAALTRTFKAWETRIQKLETDVRDVRRRNQKLRASTFLSDIDYSGGQESPVKSGFLEFSEVQSIGWDLDKIDAQVKTLESSTSELEGTIDKKIQMFLHFPSIQPVVGGWITSSFGKRIDPFTGKIEDHPGIDISIEPGSRVYASGAGIITECNTRFVPNKGYGLYIVIDHGMGYKTLYGHLSKIFVKKGQQVKRWDLIGLTGDTGKSTAPHLHYSIMQNGVEKNPYNFLL
jgi:murein DD-endopeptidase MepM/ murein hydrolase activator NlpD